MLRTRVHAKVNLLNFRPTKTNIMYRPRVIPCLLLKNLGLVKSVKFSDYKYIGDPMNAIKIFNDKKADELIFLDITASAENRLVSLDLVKQLGDECDMPFSVGGGVKSIDDIRRIINAGAEKVSINSVAVENPEFVQQAADTFGSSTIIVSIDVKKKFLGKRQVYVSNGKKSTGLNPVEFAKQVEALGAGEILINSIDHDGQMNGYDLDLVKEVSQAVSIPVVACGGAGCVDHFSDAVNQSHASAVAAGSFFVFHGPRRAVLINMPTRKEIANAFKKSVA